jgi:hypothetical protein
MSERLSSVEIEDVLSSIRRLVSEDLRPGAKAADPQAAATPAPAPESGVGKLVLTPALRIGPEAEQEAKPDAGADPGKPADTGFQSVRSARLTPMPQAGYAEDEEDLPPPSAQGDADWFKFSSTAEEGDVVRAEADPADVPSDMLELGQPVADSDVLVGEETPEAAAFDADPGPAASEDWLPEEEASIAADAAEDAFAEDAGMPEPEDPAQAPYWTRPDPVEPAPQAAEDWADVAEAEIRRELEEEAETSAFARFDAEVAGGDDRQFDEEMLRDLVRDIIREELQGALGERITRNVRKLVRAEIARALAVRDFD